MYLARQPIRKVKSSRTGEYKQLSRAAYLVRTERLYLFFMLRMETINIASVKIIIISSYVPISISPFRKTQNESIAALSAV